MRLSSASSARARVVAAGCELSERHGATVERELEQRPTRHAQAVAEADHRETVEAAGVLVATSEGVGERPPDAQHLARFLDRVQQRRLVRGQRLELPNSAHGASYIRVIRPAQRADLGRFRIRGNQRYTTDTSGQERTHQHDRCDEFHTGSGGGEDSNQPLDAHHAWTGSGGRQLPNPPVGHLGARSQGQMIAAQGHAGVVCGADLVVEQLAGPLERSR